MTQIVCSGVNSIISADDFNQCHAQEANHELHLDYNQCLLELVKQKGSCDWVRAAVDLSIFYQNFDGANHLGGRYPVIAEEIYNFFSKFAEVNLAYEQLKKAIGYNIQPELILQARLNAITNLLEGGESKISGFLEGNKFNSAIMSDEKFADRKLEIASFSSNENANDILDRKKECVENDQVRECLGLPKVKILPKDYRCKNKEQIKYEINSYVEGNNLVVTSGSFLKIVDFYCLLGAHSYNLHGINHITIKAPGFSMQTVKFATSVQSLSLEQNSYNNDPNVIKGMSVPNLSFNGSTVIFGDTNNFSQSVNLNLRNSEDLCSFYLAAGGTIISSKITIDHASSCITIASTGTLNAKLGAIAINLDSTITNGNNAMVIDQNAKIIANKLSISANNNNPAFVNKGIISADSLEIGQGVVAVNLGYLLSRSESINSEIFVNLAGGILYNDASAKFSTDYFYNLGKVTIGEFVLQGTNSAEHSKLLYNNGKLITVSSNIHTKAVVNRDAIIFVSRTQLETEILDNMSGDLVFLSNNVLVDTKKLVIEPTYLAYSYNKYTALTDFKFSMVIMKAAVEAVLNINQIEVLGGIFRSEAQLSFTNCPTIFLKSFTTSGLVVNGVILPNNINALLYLKNANVVCSNLITSMEIPGESKALMTVSDEVYKHLVPANLNAISTEVLRGMSNPELLAIIDAKKNFPINRATVGVSVDTSIFTNQVFMQGGFYFTYNMLNAISADKVKFVEIFEANKHLLMHGEVVVQFHNTDPKRLSDVTLYQSTPEGIKDFLKSIGYVSDNLLVTTGEFFEKCLIEKTLITALGLARIEGGVSINGQISALYRNAQSVYKIFGLEIGKEIPLEFIEKLGASLIWPVFKNIVMPNGKEERILFPMLYIHKNDLMFTTTGPLLEIEKSNFTITNNVINYGQLNFHEAFVHINANFINAGRITGSGEFKVNNFLQLGEIANLDKAFKILANNFIAPSITKTIQTNNGYYTVEVETGAKFRLGAAFELSVTDTLFLQNIDAEFKGKTNLHSKDMVLVPLQLIGESWETYKKNIKKLGVKVGKKTTNIHNLRITHEFGKIKAADNLSMDADNKILWVGVDISTSKGNITVHGLASTAIATINDVYMREVNTKKDYYLGSVFDSHRRHREDSSTPLPMIIKTEQGIIKLHSGHKDVDKVVESGSVMIMGVTLKATKVYLSVEEGGIINLMPAVATKFTLDEFKKSIFFSSDDGNMIFAGKKQSAHVHYQEELYPTVIQVDELFYVQAPNGTYIQTSSKVESDGTVILNAKHIFINAAGKREYIMDYEKVVGFGVAVTFSLSEVSIGSGMLGRMNSFSETKITHTKPIIYAKNGLYVLCNNNGTATYAGADIAVNGTFNSNCMEVNYVPAFDTVETSTSNTNFAALFKLGVQSGIGSLVDGMQKTANGIEQGRADGAINSAFGLLQAYTSFVSIVNNGAFNFGIWFSAAVSHQETTTTQSTPVITTVRAQEIYSEDYRVNIVGADIRAFNAFFNNHEFNIEAAIARYNQGYEHISADINIPLSAGTPSGGVSVGAGKSEAKTHFNAHLVVADNLHLNIEGDAGVSGATISARSLLMACDRLTVQSLQDTFTQRSNMVNLHTNNFGGQISDRDSSRVLEQTRIIAAEEMKIVVARSMYLAGALVANAQLDENGKLTDLGNLSLKVAELYIKHIADYDNGLTLGAGINLAKNGNSIGSFEFGYIEGEGINFATIGKGNITTNSTSGDEIKRDINDSQTWTSKQFYIDIVIPKLPTEEEREKFKDALKNGKILDSTGREFKRSFEQVIIQLQTLFTFEEKQPESLGKSPDSEKIKLSDQDKEKLAKLYKEAEELVSKVEKQEKAKASDKNQDKESDKNNKQTADTTSSTDSKSSVNERTPGLAEGKLSSSVELIKEFALKYEEFAKENPDLAKYGASILVITIKGVVGGVTGGLVGGAAGLGSGVVMELKSWIFNEVAGETINAGIEKLAKMSAPQLMEVDSTLDREDAELLIKLSIVAMASGKDLADGMKNIAKKFKHKSVSPIFEDKTSDAFTSHSSNNEVNLDVDKIDFTNTPRIELSRLSPEGRQKVLGKLSNDVPAGRIDYKEGFSYEVSNFVEGTETLFKGRLKEDLYLINYHNKNIPLGAEIDGGRTMKYATHLEVGNRIPTINEIHQHLALVPEWGPRNSYSIIKIPKGTDTTFISGKADVQFSDTGSKFRGGGYQVRFKDFDNKWIIETKDLVK